MFTVVYTTGPNVQNTEHSYNQSDVLAPVQFRSGETGAHVLRVLRGNSLVGPARLIPNRATKIKHK